MCFQDVDASSLVVAGGDAGARGDNDDHVAQKRNQISCLHSVASHTNANSSRVSSNLMYSTFDRQSVKMELQQILRTVLAEHEDPGASGSTLESLQADVEARLSDVSTVSRPVVMTNVRVPRLTETRSQRIPSHRSNFRSYPSGVCCKILATLLKSTCQLVKIQPRRMGPST